MFLEKYANENNEMDFYFNTYWLSPAENNDFRILLFSLIEFRILLFFLLYFITHQYISYPSKSLQPFQRFTRTNGQTDRQTKIVKNILVYGIGMYVYACSKKRLFKY